jgi:hypothetical protein
VDKGIIIINGIKNFREFQKQFPEPKEHWDGKTSIKPWKPFGMDCIYVKDFEKVAEKIWSALSL